MKQSRSINPLSRRELIAGAGVAAIGLALPSLLSAHTRWSGPIESTNPSVFDPHKPRLLPRALAALDTHANRISKRDLLGVVDFSEPSRVPRFHLVDVRSGQVTTHLVAHGKGSDPDHSGWVQRLSNKPDSNASSRGAFVTGHSYIGKHGLSRRLVGLDAENNLAESRGIVIHAASYVNDALAAGRGRIGRSQGCFAVGDVIIRQVMERLGPGRLVFAWK